MFDIDFFAQYLLPVKYCVLYPAEILILLLTLALLAGIRVNPGICWAIGLFAIVAIWARTAVDYPEGFDSKLFHRNGVRVWNGENPYEDVSILNPFPAPLVLALLATTDVETSQFIWTCLNLVGCSFLGFLAAKGLQAQDAEHGDSAVWHISPAHVVALSGTLAFCYASRRNLLAGQLAVLAMVMILGALWAQGLGRRFSAGAMMAVGAIKASMWLPFLFLFLRKRDWLVWVAMAVTGLGLTLFVTPPEKVIPYCEKNLDNIHVLSQPGRINDYMKFDWVNVELIMPEYALFCCGIEDRAFIDTTCKVFTVALGVLLLVWILSKRLRRAAACAMIGYYASIFLYHRQYDLVLLSLPLVYAVGRAQHERHWTRWLYGISGTASLAVLYFRLPQLIAFQERILEGGVPRIATALVMPYCVWCVLLGMAAMAVAEICRPSSADLVGNESRRWTAV